jgi:fluoride exporter
VEALPPDPGRWPWATLMANVAGAFVLGWLATRARDRRLPFLGVGVCGAFTTFATLQLELLLMLDAGRVALAAAYAIVSVCAGYAAAAVASRLAT